MQTGPLFRIPAAFPGTRGFARIHGVRSRFGSFRLVKAQKRHKNGLHSRMSGCAVSLTHSTEVPLQDHNRDLALRLSFVLSEVRVALFPWTPYP